MPCGGHLGIRSCLDQVMLLIFLYGKDLFPFHIKYTPINNLEMLSEILTYQKIKLLIINSMPICFFLTIKSLHNIFKIYTANKHIDMFFHQ